MMESSNNFFQLVVDFQKNIDWLNQILIGSDSVNIDGVVKPSITKDITDKWSAIQAMVQGRLSFKTKAQMDANTAQPVNTLAEVWDDGVADNNGLYGWTGTSWEKSKYDIKESLESDMNALRDDTLLAFESLGLTAQGTYDFEFAVTDMNGKAALGIDKNGATHMGGTAHSSVVMEEYDYAITDDQGRIAIGVTKDGAAVAGNMEVVTTQHSDYEYAITDEFNRIAFAIKKDGTVIAPLLHIPGEGTGNAPPKKEINHFLTYGQSLSMGDQGSPVVSIAQPYGNITFADGVRSGTYAEASETPYSNFIPLVEKNSAIFGGVGETVCSASCNYVTELIRDENGLPYTAHNYDLLGSTSGKGATTVSQLSKGTAPYQWLVDSITNAFRLSQSEGKTYALQAINWIQAESDYLSGTSAATWGSRVKSLHEDIKTEAQSIVGQDHLPPMIMYQIASHKKYSSKQTERTPYLAIEQLRLCNENPDMHLACPMYVIPYAPDKGHLSPDGYNMLGAYMARVYKRVIYDGSTWKPLQPKSVTKQGKIVEIDFHVPNPPLVMDTNWITPVEDGAYGFTVYDSLGKVPITVQITGETRVKVTLSRELSGLAELRYAWGEDVPNGNYSGRDIGPRGQLRDTAGNTKKFTTQGGTTFDLHNYCVIFSHAL